MADGLRWLRVHVRRTAEPGGVTTLERTVFCPNQGARVSLDACSGCGNRFAVDRRDRDTFLVCDVPESAELPEAETYAGPNELNASGDTVADVMTADVVCVTENLSVRDLLKLFLERSISGVPVVRDGKPVGIVSKTDVMHCFVGSPQTLSIPGERGETFDVTTNSCPPPDDATVRDVMTGFTLSLDVGTPIERAAAILAYEGVHRVPVVSSSLSPKAEVVGLISSIDILRWVARKAGYVVPGRTAQQRNR